MSSPIEHLLNHLPNEAVNKGVQAKEINQTKFYLVDPSSNYADPMLNAHHRAEKEIESSIPKILSEMEENKAFRNFICVNFQHFVTNNSSDFVEGAEFPGGNVYRLRSFGFKNGEDNIFDDAEKESFFQNLTEHYDRYYSELLYSNNFQLDYDKNLFDPLIKAADFLEVHDDALSLSRDHTELDTSNNKTNSFLTAQQIHLIYEKYINYLVSKATNSSEVIENPSFIFSPTFNRGSIKGYVELDGFLISSGEELILIECKNSRYLRQNHVTNFLGKARLLEEVYDVEFKKYIVSTGELGYMLSGMDSLSLSKDIKFFNKTDHQNNYSNLIGKIRE